jgi:hypothetical protein
MQKLAFAGLAVLVVFAFACSTAPATLECKGCHLAADDCCQKDGMCAKCDKCMTKCDRCKAEVRSMDLCPKCKKCCMKCDKCAR